MIEKQRHLSVTTTIICKGIERTAGEQSSGGLTVSSSIKIKTDMKTDLLQTYLSRNETDKQTVRKFIGEVLDKHPFAMGEIRLGIAITDDSIKVGSLNHCPFSELHVSVKLPSWVLDTGRENIVDYIIEEYDRMVNPTNEYYKNYGEQL